MILNQPAATALPALARAVGATTLICEDIAAPEEQAEVAALREADHRVRYVALDDASNTIGPALVLAHFAPLLAKGERSLLAVLAALHPGTVDSALSAPFRGAQIGRPAPDAARDLLAVLDTLQPADSGGFWAYDGQRLPW